MIMTKNNNKKKKSEYVPPKIPVENKSDVILIPSNIAKMSDEEIKKMLNKISEDNKKIMNECYSSDLCIKKIQQRSFFDLVKKFFEKSNDAITFYDLLSMMLVRK